MDRDYEVRKSNKVYVSNLNLSVPLLSIRSLKTISKNYLKSMEQSKTSLSNKKTPSPSPSSSSTPPTMLKKPSMSTSQPTQSQRAFTPRE